MEAGDEIILDRNSFLHTRKGKLDFAENIKLHLPIVEISELYFMAEKKDISAFKIKDFLQDIEPMQIGVKTSMIYSGLRKFFSRKEKFGNTVYRDNLYYLASLAIEYGFPLYVSKENYNALKNFHHDDLVLVKSE